MPDVDRPDIARDLAEAQAYQLATGDVLRVMAASPGNVAPVFEAIVAASGRLCDAEFSAITQYDGEHLHLVAVSNMSPQEMAAYRSLFPRPAHRGYVIGRAFLDRVPAHVEDVTQDPNYDPRTLSILQSAAPYRSYLGIPILQDGAAIGAIGLGRRKVAPFSERQVKLVQTFADQAAIAIKTSEAYSALHEKSRKVEEQAAELAEWNRSLEQRVAQQVAQIGRMSRLTRFLSPKVSDMIVSADTDEPLKARRAEITVVYVDLRGFTSFTETAEPEEVMSVLRQYHAELGKLIMAHDGTIEHFAGDGMMIMFNAPLPVEDHEFLAVRMALEMRAALGDLSTAWRKRGHELGFGVGIAGGYATIGTIGFEQRLDYGAVGPATNLAARLCSEAKNLQILIAPRIFAKLERRIRVEPVGELSLKGFQRPIPAYNVLSADLPP